MTLWFIFGSMTVAAILVVLWPLRPDRRAVRGGSDVIVYKDQLQEIDRDRAAGLIGEAEAEAARLEVSRRLLAAADAQSVQGPTPSVSQNQRRRRVAAVAALVILPFGPPTLYVALGSPNIPDAPAFARAGEAPQTRESLTDLVGQVEVHLAHHPDDGRGWELIAPVYMRLGRFDDAVEAQRKSLALNGDTPTREADLGESLVAAANGMVTADAKAAFDRAVARDPHEAKARYFLGLAAKQDGKNQRAAEIWQSLLADAPAGAPWVPFVRGALARATGASTGEPGPSATRVPTGSPGSSAGAGPSATDIEAAASMSADKRLQMIQGMVARLAERLHGDGADVEGWLRLMRAYVVLGDRNKAKDAAVDARRALSDHPDAVKRIDALVKGLGLEG